MKTNYIMKLMMLAAPALLFSSCLKDNDEVFDESRSQSMQNAMNNAREVLRSAKNGWVMDYYLDEEAQGGGYAFYVKFDSLTVSAMSETTPEMETSYYKMTNDNGPSLTFDTYNPVLHEFATPSATEYEAQGGDYEFMVMRATPELVTLRGRRTNNYIYLRPLPEGTTPQEYLDNVLKMQDSIAISIGKGVLDGMTINATLNLDSRQATFVNEADSSTLINCAFTYTDKGIRLNQNIDFAPRTVNAFAYDGTTDRLTCTDGGTTDFVMQGSYPATWLAYDEIPGTYMLNYIPDGQTNMETIRVQVVSNGDNETYTMNGLNSNFGLTCIYRKSHGSLEIRSHRIMTVGSYDMHLCMMNNQGYLTWATQAGIEFTWNGDRDNMVLNAGFNDYEDFLSFGFLLWLFREGSSQTGTIVRDWFASHTNYYMNGSYFIENIENLTRVD